MGSPVNPRGRRSRFYIVVPPRRHASSSRSATFLRIVWPPDHLVPISTWYNRVAPRPHHRVLGLALVLLVGAVQAHAKGDGRAFFLDGVVSDVRSVDGFLEFDLAGSLLVETCERNRCSTDPWAQDAKIPVRVDPASESFAMGTGSIPFSSWIACNKSGLPRFSPRHGPSGSDKFL